MWHFAKRIKWRDIGACGRWAVNTTHLVDQVTCSACKRTSLYAAALFTSPTREKT